VVVSLPFVVSRFIGVRKTVADKNGDESPDCKRGGVGQNLSWREGRFAETGPGLRYEGIPGKKQPVLTALVSGLLLGLSCGLAPGPLMTLVLAQSLRHGSREGCKVALAPLVTDLPIILAAVAVASRAAEYQKVIGTLSIAGGLFVLYLAVDTIRPLREESNVADTRPRSWFKGILANLLSPHPWLFWMTVGAATLAKAMAASWLAAAAFLVVFYLLLVGSKLLLALAAGRSRDFLNGRPYRLIMQVLGILLGVFALLLLFDGLQRLW
jgi:threonine/homoserine/homoserine lactone efflux protein